MQEEKSDEDCIIDALIIEGRNALYEDIDFLPLKQSLYNSEVTVPAYDDNSGHLIEWCRPHVIFEHPVYFSTDSKQSAIKQGTLPDQLFLGTLMAIAVYPRIDLIENIFASRPDDFLKYGLYTCRFYVEGEWVEVIADTNIPCVKDNMTGNYCPAYGASTHPDEVWIPFVEKAFAKAMGNYEEISNMKVQKALLHLTGGSVQTNILKDHVSKLDQQGDGEAWRSFRHKIDNNVVIILTSSSQQTMVTALNNSDDVEDNSTSVSAAGNSSIMLEESMAGTTSVKKSETFKYFSPDLLYSVILYREINGHELVLMHNPYRITGYKWTGEWSDTSHEWDIFPDVLFEITQDHSIPWTRFSNNGYFWISFRNVTKFFGRAYYCKLFPNERYHFYCARGGCKQRSAAGPLLTVRDKESVLRDHQQSKVKVGVKATVEVVIDGDSSWFNNPQYRLHCLSPTGMTRVYISILPLLYGGGDENTTLQLTVTKTNKQSNLPANLWDITQFDVLTTDKDDVHTERSKGQESALWNLELDSKHYYHIVPNALKRGLECEFILRVFSTKPVSLESINPVQQMMMRGAWKRSGDIDTSGGPLFMNLLDDTKRFNPKWSQNPQYHLEVVDPFGKDEIYLKIVIKRTDLLTEKRQMKYSHQDGETKKASDCTVGLVIAKADVLDDMTKRVKKKPPKQNIMGELLPIKESTLKKKPGHEELVPKPSSSSIPKTILRKLAVDNNSYYIESTYNSKADACIFYPKIPRSWIPDGLIIVPSLSDKNIKGAFDLEVYASEKIFFTQLPEAFTRTIAGDWTESNSGGNHLNPGTWKKNPKYTLRFLQPMTSEEPIFTRISIARVGSNWKIMSKKDTIGCMIGFYIFISNNNNNNNNELKPFYESLFIPEDEITTDVTFRLPQITHSESYIIMPTTYSEGKLGSYVLSVLSEYEFSITKEKEK